MWGSRPSRMLPNVPNFRQLEGTKIYRSSKPERMREEDIKIVKTNLGIKSIVDLREPTETKNPILSDKYYSKHNRRRKTNQENEGFIKEVVNGKGMEDEKSIEPIDIDIYKRYIVAMYGGNFKTKTFSSWPYYIKMISWCLFIIDKLFTTTYFLKFITRYASNDGGLYKQYTSVIEFAGEDGICVVLRLLSKPTSVPAMICCALGKDRTGIITALIYSLLGKSDDFIAMDYAISEDALLSVQSEEGDQMKRLNLINSSFGTAKYETMIQLLEFIKSRYGGVSDYLTSNGFGPSEQEILLENIRL